MPSVFRVTKKLELRSDVKNKKCHFRPVQKNIVVNVCDKILENTNGKSFRDIIEEILNTDVSKINLKTRNHILNNFFLFRYLLSLTQRSVDLAQKSFHHSLR
jgi:hypothetical protein